jgi:GDSL-like Lipase/Acylhydrolase family
VGSIPIARSISSDDPFRDLSSLRRKLGWSALAMVILIAASELVLRFAWGFGSPLLYAVDPHAGYVAAPNQQLRRFGATIHINKYGMRSDDLDPAPPRGELRIFFLGDSVTFGTTSVSQEKIFTEIIKNRLRATENREVEILNASAGGWATANEYQYLASRGTFDANLVVFVINQNDLDQPMAAPVPAVQYPTSNPESAIIELWIRYLKPRIFHVASGSDPGSSAESVPDAAANDRVLASLEAAREFAEGHGAHFAIIYTPCTHANEKTAAWQAMIGKFMDWAARDKISLITMNAAFAAHERKLVYIDDIHLRPLGHELIATEFLNRMGGLLGSPQ